jgi:hypothetical protein
MATPQIVGNGPIPFPFMPRKRDKSYPNDDYRFRPMSMEEFHAMIDRSEEDIRAGRTTPHSEVKKLIATWISK